MRNHSFLSREMSHLVARQFGHITREQLLALSHLAAVALWGAGEWPRLLEVTAPGEHRRPGLWTHRSCTLTPADLRVHDGIRVTAPIRCVIDVQPRLTDARLIRVVNDLRVAGHLGPADFARLLARSARIGALLGDGGLTRSALEDLFRRFVTRHRLPMPELNARLPGSGREVDAFYREARLIIEVDSWRHHGDRASFERDRAKDARALGDGYRTLRPTERRLRRDGHEEAAIIRRLLATA